MFMAQKQKPMKLDDVFRSRTPRTSTLGAAVELSFQHQRSLRGGASFYRYPVQYHPHITAGWWYTYPSEKYEFVSWDYYSQCMEK